MSGHIPCSQSRPPDSAARTSSRYSFHMQQSGGYPHEISSYPGTLDPSEKGTRCLILLERCLAIKLIKVSLHPDGKKISESRSFHNGDFWMYDNGYLLFQDFLEQNLKCFWNTALLEAVRVLKFRGYVAPGVLMVTANPCALEVVRSAWSRNVLRPPTNFIILIVGDITDCVVEPLPQGHFTPLPEALCWVILELTSSGQSAVLPEIFSALQNSFPDMEVPSNEVIYDVLAQLMAEEKVYQTSKGFFVMTPERKRRDINQYRRHHRKYGNNSKLDSKGMETYSLLMSPEEALVLVHGEMQTIRDGDVTHQSLQTNLADIICGGNPNDKIIYPNEGKKNRSSPLQRHTDRRHSLRLFGSSKRLSSSPNRCSSLRHIPSKPGLQTENSTSTVCRSRVCSGSCSDEKKPSFLSRLFRRSVKKRASAPAAPVSTFGAQFPPAEWFNPRVVHLHSVGTQTQNVSSKLETPLSSDVLSSITPWTDDGDSKAATLPRRHRRLASGDSAISLTTYNQSHTVTTTSNSTPRSSRRHRSPSFRSQAQHQVNSFYGKSDSISCSTSRNSVITHLVPVPLQNSSLSPGVAISSECCKLQASALPVQSNISCNRKVTSCHTEFPNSNKLPSSPSRNSYSVKSSVKCSSHKLSSNKTLCSNKTVTVRRHGNHKERELIDDATVSYNSEKPTQVTSNVSFHPQNKNLSSTSQSGGDKNVLQFELSPGTGNFISLNSSYSSQKVVKNEESNVTQSKNGHTNSTVSTVETGKKVMVKSALYTSSLSNTAISECNTNTNLQQNSQVNSFITLENGVKNNKNSGVHTRGDSVFLNSLATTEEDSKPSHDENSQINERNLETDVQPILLGPDAIKHVKDLADSSGFYVEIDCKSQKNDCIESVTEEVEHIKLSCEFDCKKECKKGENGGNKRRSTGILLKFGNTSETDVTLYPNNIPPQFLHQSSNAHTINNTQTQTSLTAAVLPVKSKEELDYKNVFQKDISLLVDDSFSLGLKNDVLSNVASTTKSSDNFKCSFGNLILKDINSDDKLNAPRAQEFVTELKNFDGRSFNNHNIDFEEKCPKLSPCASFSDFGVNFKSLTAQNMMKGISISSIDTLVEVNMAVAEKQDYDMSIYTDLGML